jgi:hypothetical protein
MLELYINFIMIIRKDLWPVLTGLAPSFQGHFWEELSREPLVLMSGQSRHLLCPQWLRVLVDRRVTVWCTLQRLTDLVGAKLKSWWLFWDQLPPSTQIGLSRPLVGRTGDNSRRRKLTSQNVPFHLHGWKLSGALFVCFWMPIWKPTISGNFRLLWPLFIS